MTRTAKLSWLSGFGEIPDSGWVWFAKLVGALAGSAVSIVYVLPRNRREAASRLVVGVITGLIFGTTVGHHVAIRLALNETLSKWEITLVGATLSSLAAWWVIGMLIRLANRYQA